MALLKYFDVISCLLFCFNAMAKDNTPYLYILGVVQDAGYPQTGCYQKHCLPGWEDATKQRGAVSLGLIDPKFGKKYMFEATPNFPAQLYDLEQEAPTEQFAFDGIFLTHAHIGHYAGLMFLGHEAMSSKEIPVYAMPKMRKFLENNGPWGQLVKYKNIILNTLSNNKGVSLDQIRVIPFLVPHRDEYSETVGYRIVGPNKSAVFIPDINKWEQWDADLDVVIKTADYVLLDAAFYADGELPGRDMSKIPHPFVSETIAELADLSKEQRKKVWFIHMNHTNPLLNENSPESQKVKALGFNIAKEGIKLGL